MFFSSELILSKLMPKTFKRKRADEPEDFTQQDYWRQRTETTSRLQSLLDRSMTGRMNDIHQSIAALDALEASPGYPRAAMTDAFRTVILHTFARYARSYSALFAP